MFSIHLDVKLKVKLLRNFGKLVTEELLSKASGKNPVSPPAHQHLWCAQLERSSKRWWLRCASFKCLFRRRRTWGYNVLTSLLFSWGFFSGYRILEGFFFSFLLLIDVCYPMAFWHSQFLMRCRYFWRYHVYKLQWSTQIYKSKVWWILICVYILETANLSNIWNVSVPRKFLLPCQV